MQQKSYLCAMQNKSILISGTFRGGTTAVTNIIKALGVPLAGQVTQKTLEDIKVRRLMHSNLNVDSYALIRLAKKYTTEHGTFAIKYPHLFKHMSTCLQAFLRPYFVIVTRDPLAVAYSEARHKDGSPDFIDNFMRASYDAQHALRCTLNHPDAKIKLISFEYLISPSRNKQEIKKLAEWLELKPSAATISEIAAALVVPEIEEGKKVKTNYPIF